MVQIRCSGRHLSQRCTAAEATTFAGEYVRGCIANVQYLPDQSTLAMLLGQFCIHSRQGQKSADVGGQ